MACVVLEGIQLGPDFIADLGRAEHAQPAAHDERANLLRLQQERVLCEIQVQAGFGQPAVQSLELWRPLCQAGAPTMQLMACVRPISASCSAALHTPACRPKSSTAMHR